MQQKLEIKKKRETFTRSDHWVKKIDRKLNNRKRRGIQKEKTKKSGKNDRDQKEEIQEEGMNEKKTTLSLRGGADMAAGRHSSLSPPTRSDPLRPFTRETKSTGGPTPPGIHY